MALQKHRSSVDKLAGYTERQVGDFIQGKELRLNFIGMFVKDPCLKHTGISE